MKRLPSILTGIYLALLILGVIPVFTGDDALSGIFAVVLAAPWPMLLDKPVAIPEGGVYSSLVLIAIGGLINAALIFLVSRWLAGKFGG